MTYRKLGDLLLAEGLITPLQLSIALAAQQTSSRRIGEILVEREFATEAQIAECLAKQYSYPLADLDGLKPQPSVVSLLNADLAVEHVVLPVQANNETIEVVMADPLDVFATDIVTQATRKRVIVSIAPRTSLLAKIRQAYGLDEAFVGDLSGYPLPTRFGSLRARRKLGDVVLFDAVDHELDRKVTLTAVPSNTEAERTQRWLIQAAARVPNKHVCSIYDWFEYEGNTWAVFERLEGESLAHVLRTRGARTLTQAADLVAQIAEGVDELNQAGGRCGLVCSENILIRPNGVLLTPFVQPGLEYRSPEQEMGAPGSPASDVFALGTLLWECYTGQNPHVAEATNSNQKSSWADPTTIDAQTPTALIDVLTNCLAKEPNERYASAVLVANTLRSYNWQAVATSHAAKLAPSAGDRDQLLSVITMDDDRSEKVGFWRRLFAGRQAA